MIMLTDWLQVMSAVGSILSGLGLLGTMATVFVLVRQTRVAQQATITSAYQSIIAMGSTVNALVLENPEIYTVFHDTAFETDRWELQEEIRLRPQAASAATQTLDYFEMVLVAIAAFPPALQDEWRDYIRGIITRSPYLRRAVLDTDWYAEELRALVMEPS